MIVYLANDLKTQSDYTPLKNDEEEEVTEKLVMEVDEELEEINKGKNLKIKIAKYAVLISLIVVTTNPLPLPASFVR